MTIRPLHIGVDGRELVGQPTGVGRYLRCVLEEWSAVAGFPHRLTVFLHRDPPVALRALPHVEWHVAAGGGGTLWEQTRLPRALADAHADTFFAVGYTAPVRMPCPFVVVVHDVSFFTHPEWFRWREGLRRRWLTARAARRAATVLTVSEFSAREIGGALGVRPEKIRLAPPGAPAPRPSDSARAPVVLYVGAMFNRRHVTDLVEAFADVRGRIRDARLVLVGVNRSAPTIDPLARVSELGLSDAVTWHEYVDDRMLEDLYANARAFAFLSEYEGFAMTPLEALAHGVPPLLLDTPVAREIYEQAALFVRLDRRRIADGLITLLEDEPTRTRILAAGQERLARYSWTRTAEVIRDALERSVTS